MTEHQAETKDTSAAPSQPPVPQTSFKPPASQRRGGVLALLALLVALVALAGTGWQWWQTQQVAPATDYSADLERLQQQLQQNRTDLSRIERERDSALEQLRMQDAELAQRQQSHTAEIQSLTARLAEFGRIDRGLWQLAEAEYLMQLAQQRLRTTTDAAGALALLQEADTIVRAQRDPDLYPVRSALAEEIAALEAVPDVDVEGLYLRLDALAKQAQKLPLVPAPEWQQEQPEQSATPDNAAWDERLQRGFAAAWDKLSGYIRVRRHEQPLEPLLAPPVERAVRLNLQLLMDQAQLALLAGNPELLRHSLARAQDWLARYYQLKPAATEAIIDGLAKVAATPIAPDLPELGAARRALADYLAGREKDRGEGA